MRRVTVYSESGKPFATFDGETANIDVDLAGRVMIVMGPAAKLRTVAVGANHTAVVETVEVDDAGKAQAAKEAAPS